jgi:unsaturated rhamnogalacturonyl hydrolase
MGWYLMALVDILDVLPADHPQRGEIVRALRDGADAVARVQDPVTGLWYDVMDQPNRAGNYHEASASSMFAYAFAKGHRQGHLDPSFRRHAERAFDGIVRDFVTVDAEGTVSLNRIVQVSGLGGAQRRDGSFAYYISEPIVSNDYKGVGPFVLAALELGR